MKRLRVILVCLISIVLATAASAAWIPLTDEIPLSSLEGGSFIFGDKEVSGQTVSLRHRRKGDLGSLTIEQLICQLSDETVLSEKKRI